MEVEEGPQDFVAHRAVYQQPNDWLWAYFMINDVEIPKAHPFFPRIGVPVCRESFGHFVHHVSQHLDPQGILDLPKMDRWWISALIYVVPPFKAFILNHIASFRSRNSSSQLRLRILDSFEYLQVVEEVVVSSRQERITFMSFLCVFGTGKMLSPFRDFDFQLAYRRGKGLVRQSICAQP